MIGFQKCLEIGISAADFQSAGDIGIMVLIPRLEFYGTGQIDQSGRIITLVEMAVNRTLGRVERIIGLNMVDMLSPLQPRGDNPVIFIERFLVERDPFPSFGQ